MEQQGTNMMEDFKAVSVDSVSGIEKQVKKYFEGRTWLYAVLDYTVGFGIFENDCFWFWPGAQEKPVPLDWKYLQELRIFNRSGELRLKPLKSRWVGRFRGSISDWPKNYRQMEEFCIDEKQKLWGKARKSDKINQLHWSLLTSARGTRIWIPMEMTEQEEAAISVRKFMRIPTADCKELVYQTDVRMMDFCLWKEEI